jgi:hypothetical protein
MSSWLIALPLAANLIIATPVAAQSASRAATATSATSVVQDDDSPDLNPVQSDFMPGDLPTNLRSPSFKGMYLSQQSLGTHDSLNNGAIIGTVIGAAAFGAFAAALCHAYQEADGASCLRDTLRFAAIGGAIGAGAGLAIDATRSQRGVTVRLAVRF